MNALLHDLGNCKYRLHNLGQDTVMHGNGEKDIKDIKNVVLGVYQLHMIRHTRCVLTLVEAAVVVAGFWSDGSKSITCY